MSNSLRPHGLEPARLLCPWDTPGKNTGVRFKSCQYIRVLYQTRVLQNVLLGVLVTQSRPTLCNPMNCSQPGSSVHGISQVRILEWIAISFSRGSSQPWDQTWVSCIAGSFFTIWATREAPKCSPSLWLLSFHSLHSVLSEQTFFWLHSTAYGILAPQPGIDWIQTTCTGSMESQPLNHQGIPRANILNFN